MLVRPHLDIEFSVQERHGPVGVRLEECYRKVPGDGKPSCEDRVRAGAVQPAEEKAPGRAESGLWVPKGAVRNKGMVFSRVCVLGDKGEWFQTKRGDLEWI